MGRNYGGNAGLRFAKDIEKRGDKWAWRAYSWGDLFDHGTAKTKAEAAKAVAAAKERLKAQFAPSVPCIRLDHKALSRFRILPVVRLPRRWNPSVSAGRPVSVIYGFGHDGYSATRKVARRIDLAGDSLVVLA